jgi:hypothetical protein
VVVVECVILDLRSAQSAGGRQQGQAAGGRQQGFTEMFLLKLTSLPTGVSFELM